MDAELGFVDFARPARTILEGSRPAKAPVGDDGELFGDPLAHRQDAEKVLARRPRAEAPTGGQTLPMTPATR